MIRGFLIDAFDWVFVITNRVFATGLFYSGFFLYFCNRTLRELGL